MGAIKVEPERRKSRRNKGRCTGVKFLLDSLTTKINSYRTELVNQEKEISAIDLIDYVNGKYKRRNKVLEEFQEHNNEIADLVKKGEYAGGTLERYQTACSHVKEFIKLKFDRDDLTFTSLNYEFIKNYNHYLRTKRACSNNTSLKYISNLKKNVLRAVAKDIIPKDPFKLFSGKKTKVKKKPLTKMELQRIEEKVFSSNRLSVVRDVFVFQCYTGLAYIDAFNLRWQDIKEGNDGSMWIMSNRQKSKSTTDIPLLSKALEVMAKYNNHPACLEKGTVLPVRSNQKMNEYLKEIAALCGIYETLNTHKARRTFASTVTLNNGVSIHVVKEMLGHHSVKQTEEYAITEQEAIGHEMKVLRSKLNTHKDEVRDDDLKTILLQFKREFDEYRESQKK